MTTEQFVYWLQGFMETADPKTINETQTQIIKDHLDLVFNKVTPDRKSHVEGKKKVKEDTKQTVFIGDIDLSKDNWFKHLQKRMEEQLIEGKGIQYPYINTPGIGLIPEWKTGDMPFYQPITVC